MTGTYPIRTARPEDFDAIADLTETAYRVDGFLDGDEEYAATLRDVAGRAAAGDIRVAVDASDRPVAAVALIAPPSSWTDIAVDGEIEIRMLAVRPDYRRRGIARALMRDVLDRTDPERTDPALLTLSADGRPFRAIVLSSLARMSMAHALYTELGFERVPERDWQVEDIELIVLGKELIA